MFSPYSELLFGKDLFNHNNERNADNTDQFAYNCGGYALGTFSWYLPSRTYIWAIDANWTMDKMQEITDIAVKVMLEDFTDLRIIQDMRQLHRDEYAIAFRVANDGDFHYIKQIHHRTWSHKCGNTAIQTMSQRAVFGSKWCDRYDGPIVLLAKKRGT